MMTFRFLVLSALIAMTAACASIGLTSGPSSTNGTSRFGTVSKSDTLYSTALDAHDLADGLKKAGTEGAFKGTVSQVYAPEDGDMCVLDFDPQFRTAMVAFIARADIPKFSNLKALAGKEVVITGKFATYQGRPQIVLTSPDQIRLVH